MESSDEEVIERPQRKKGRKKTGVTVKGRGGRNRGEGGDRRVGGRKGVVLRKGGRSGSTTKKKAVLTETDSESNSPSEYE
jgi:hypothetical protein